MVARLHPLALPISEEMPFSCMDSCVCQFLTEARKCELAYHWVEHIRKMCIHVKRLEVTYARKGPYSALSYFIRNYSGKGL
jgi:hypothetical protein